MTNAASGDLHIPFLRGGSCACGETGTGKCVEWWPQGSESSKSCFADEDLNSIKSAPHGVGDRG